MHKILIEAALLIAYDNGMINRCEPEADFIATTISVLGNYSADELALVANELSALKEVGLLDDVCCGEEPFPDNRTTELTKRVLNAIFEGESA